MRHGAAWFLNDNDNYGYGYGYEYGGMLYVLRVFSGLQSESLLQLQLQLQLVRLGLMVTV